MTYSRVARHKRASKKEQTLRYSLRKASTVGLASAVVGVIGFHAPVAVQAEEIAQAEVTVLAEIPATEDELVETLVAEDTTETADEAIFEPVESSVEEEVTDSETEEPSEVAITSVVTEQENSEILSSSEVSEEQIGTEETAEVAETSETTEASTEEEKASETPTENAEAEATSLVEDTQKYTSADDIEAIVLTETDKKLAAAYGLTSTAYQIALAANLYLPDLNKRQIEALNRMQLRSDAETGLRMTNTELLVTVIETLEKLEPAISNIVENNLSFDEIAKLSADDIINLNKIDFTNNEIVGTGATITYKNLKDVVATFLEQDSRYAVPYFKADTIINMPAFNTVDAQTMEKEEIDVWDSWPVQDAVTGIVSNWNGYQLVISMAGAANKNSNHIYLLYNEYGNNDFSNWRNAGPIFGYGLDADSQEWSGSATVNSDGSIQLYYTKNDTSNNKLNHQQLASATINLKIVDGEVVIDSVENDQVLFGGDGYHYQNYAQFASTFYDDLNGDGDADRVDNYTLRDPHIMEVDGERYLVFEANTGTENYQGTSQVYNWSNYGGDAAFNLSSFLNITRNPELYKLASWANGAIGIVRLGGSEKKPHVAEVYTPLLTSHMTTDEIERPSVTVLNGKYYLFMASRINKSTDAEGTVAARAAVGDDVVMLGYVSDSLFGEYKPLNGSGVVLTASVPADWRTSTYSYYAVPIEGDNSRVLITSYMTNRGGVAGEEMKSTMAPSFLLQINEDDTTQVLPYYTNQGDWIGDEGSLTDYHKGTNETARLPHEDFEVYFEAIGQYGYGLKPHLYDLGDKEDSTPGEKPELPSETPEVPVVTPEEGGADAATNETNPATKKTAEKSLPNTSSVEEKSSIVTGLALLGFASLFSLARKGRKEA